MREKENINIAFKELRKNYVMLNLNWKYQHEFILKVYFLAPSVRVAQKKWHPTKKKYSNTNGVISKGQRNILKGFLLTKFDIVGALKSIKIVIHYKKIKFKNRSIVILKRSKNWREG